MTEDKSVEKYIDGKEIWKIILERKVSTGEKVYFGGFSGYDDTPRRGISGTVIDIGVDDFYENLIELLCKNEQYGNDITFINAWNEWGEGMYLEPDVIHQYQYLEAIQRAVENYKTTVYQEKETKANGVSGTELLVERYRSYWKILNSWLTLKEDGKRLDDYLISKAYSNIAIYGIGMIGLHLVKELEGTLINIKYGIDQRGNNIHQKFPIYRREDELPQVDAIIVSATYEFGDIYQYLRSKMDCPIISVEEIVDESMAR